MGAEELGPMGRLREIERDGGGTVKAAAEVVCICRRLYFHNNFESVLSFGDDPGVSHACSCTPFPISFLNVDSEAEYFTPTDNQQGWRTDISFIILSHEGCIHNLSAFVCKWAILHNDDCTLSIFYAASYVFLLKQDFQCMTFTQKDQSILSLLLFYSVIICYNNFMFEKVTAKTKIMTI